MSASTSFAQNA